jgi:hypothetical protein
LSTPLFEGVATDMTPEEEALSPPRLGSRCQRPEALGPVVGQSGSDRVLAVTARLRSTSSGA